MRLLLALAPLFLLACGPDDVTPDCASGVDDGVACSAGHDAVCSNGGSESCHCLQTGVWSCELPLRGDLAVPRILDLSQRAGAD